MKELMLYLHIPFCARKCAYCDFLSFPAGEAVVERYLGRLLEEISEYKEAFKAYQVSSIFVGGGTPSLLSAAQITRLMDGICGVFAVEPLAEITMEANPGTLNKEKLSAYKSAGVNRLSLGLQSADDRELKLLGRIHTYEQFYDNYREARRAGFSNINVDIMSALPSQSVDSYRKTLEKIIALSPEHISAYSLIMEEGTPFYEKYKEDDARRARGDKPHILPSEEEERYMYALTAELLEKGGYHRYEISNYAKSGRECRHNCGYWQGREYLGLGLGASSYINGSRMKNRSDLRTYLESPFSREERVVLSRRERMEEFMFLGLRLMEGVSEKEFERSFGRSMQEVYGPVLSKFESAKLMEKKDGRWRLTEQGIDVSNYILSDFLL